MAKAVLEAAREGWERLGDKRGVLLGAVVVVLVGIVLALGISRSRDASAANFEAGLEALAYEDYATAVRRFRAVSGQLLAPHRVAAAFYLAVAQEGLGEYADSIQGFETFLRENPDHLLAPLAARNLILVREAAGDTAAARNSAARAVETYGDGPIGPWIRIEAARLASAEGDTAAARALLAPILARSASDTDPAAALLPWARALVR